MELVLWDRRDIPICWAPALMSACFAAEVAPGLGHWKGSPSAPRGARVLRLVGMAKVERATVDTRVTMLSLENMLGYLVKRR